MQIHNPGYYKYVKWGHLVHTVQIFLGHLANLLKCDSQNSSKHQKKVCWHNLYGSPWIWFFFLWFLGGQRLPVSNSDPLSNKRKKPHKNPNHRRIRELPVFFNRYSMYCTVHLLYMRVECGIFRPNPKFQRACAAHTGARASKFSFSKIPGCLNINIFFLNWYKASFYNEVQTQKYKF